MRRVRRTTILVSVLMGMLMVPGQSESQSQNRKKPPRRENERRRDRSPRSAEKLKVGKMAPDFTLKSLDGPEKVTLSDFRGKRPVVLIFGSYT